MRRDVAHANTHALGTCLGFASRTVVFLFLFRPDEGGCLDCERGLHPGQVRAKAKLMAGSRADMPQGMQSRAMSSPCPTLQVVGSASPLQGDTARLGGGHSCAHSDRTVEVLDVCGHCDAPWVAKSVLGYARVCAQGACAHRHALEGRHARAPRPLSQPHQEREHARQSLPPPPPSKQRASFRHAACCGASGWAIWQRVRKRLLAASTTAP